MADRSLILGSTDTVAKLDTLSTVSLAARQMTIVVPRPCLSSIHRLQMPPRYSDFFGLSTPSVYKFGQATHGGLNAYGKSDEE
jgi:hypothetical protein